MKKRELYKSIILLMIASVFVFSWFQFPNLERTSSKKSLIYQISENTDIKDGVPLRSMAEEISEVEHTSGSLDYVSIELFYSTIIKVHLIQKQFENNHFESCSKRYLKLLRILI